MAELPEGRRPLLWKDMEFADRPKGHPSTERLEIDRLRESMWRAVNLIESGRYEQAKAALARTLKAGG